MSSQMAIREVIATATTREFRTKHIRAYSISDVSFSVLVFFPEPTSWMLSTRGQILHQKE